MNSSALFAAEALLFSQKDEDLDLDVVAIELFLICSSEE